MKKFSRIGSQKKLKKKIQKAYFHGLLARLQKSNHGGDFIAFRNEYDFIVGRYTLKEIFFKWNLDFASIIADECEEILWVEKHRADPDYIKKRCKLQYKNLLKRDRLHCHPVRFWILDSVKHKEAIDEIQRHWGSHWEFLPMRIHSKERYDEYLKEMDEECRIQQEENKMYKIEKKQLYKQYNADCIEVFGRGLDKKDNFLKTMLYPGR